MQTLELYSMVQFFSARHEQVSSLNALFKQTAATDHTKATRAALALVTESRELCKLMKLSEAEKLFYQMFPRIWDSGLAFVIATKVVKNNTGISLPPAYERTLPSFSVYKDQHFKSRCTLRITPHLVKLHGTGNAQVFVQETEVFDTWLDSVESGQPGSYQPKPLRMKPHELN